MIRFFVLLFALLQSLIPHYNIAPSAPIPTQTPFVVPTASATVTARATPTPSVIEPTITSPSTTTYVVQSGDTLVDLAARFNLTVEDLARMNHIAQPDLIFPGQVFTVGKWTPVLPTPKSCAGKEIDVIISSQRVYAFDNCEFIREFVVSTGRFRTATPTGEYVIIQQLRYDDMKGPDYNLKDVPFVQYFDDRGDSFHGTYWHHNFGVPMSHGCVNMYTPDAEWLFHWASLGTRVHIAAE